MPGRRKQLWFLPIDGTAVCCWSLHVTAELQRQGDRKTPHYGVILKHF